MTAHVEGSERTDAFAGSREAVEGVLAWLEGEEAAGLAHAELESRLEVDGREMLRQFLQDHLDVRASRETRMGEVTGVDGITRRAGEAGHERHLTTVFGEVCVNRIAYRRRGHPNLHPADAALNLPTGHHSHGLRRLAAVEASRGSFDDAVDAIARATGQHVGKREVEDAARGAAVDFEGFYATRSPSRGAGGDLVVISADGKGVVMLPGALRKLTAAAAASAKLETRLSKGEKRNRKRMATVGAVYDTTPVPRCPGDILAGPDEERAPPTPGPVAANKWLVASVVDDAATVVARIFDEAERRDPEHRRTWVALVDGNNHQIDRIHAEAKARNLTVAVICDFVHVIEYLWSAAWSFHDEGDPAAEVWVRTKALAVLAGDARLVAAAIRRTATNRRLDKAKRANADTCATYLTNKAPYLDYATALRRGWPIATGVIEGACRHLVKDRMDLTGARWGLDGAEAVLRLRAIRSNGDFETYWRYHLRQERQRVHLSRYAADTIPQAA